MDALFRTDGGGRHRAVCRKCWRPLRQCLAETINGLCEAAVIQRRGPWRNFKAVEFATLEWIDWFNHGRLMEPIGNVPAAEAEDRRYAMLDALAMAALLEPKRHRKSRGGSVLLTVCPVSAKTGHQFIAG